MTDPRFQGVTLHVGWWGGFSLTNTPGVVRLNPTAHPTEWVDAAAEMVRNWHQLWCNQPLVADAFPANRVRVWSKSGKSKLLSERPEAAQSSDVLTSGDMWMLFGEAWVDEEAQP